MAERSTCSRRSRRARAGVWRLQPGLAPVPQQGKPRAGRGAKAQLLGSTERSDGSIQVTYRGHPLHYYEGDTQPGEVGCQNVVEFGGLWLIVAPNGEAIRS